MAEELLCECGFGPPHPPSWDGACPHSLGLVLRHNPRRHRLLHLAAQANFTGVDELTAKRVGNRWGEFYLNDRLLRPETANEIRLCFAHFLLLPFIRTATRTRVVCGAGGGDLLDAWSAEGSELAQLKDDEL